jgi:hypothetical protein
MQQSGHNKHIDHLLVTQFSRPVLEYGNRKLGAVLRGPRSRRASLRCMEAASAVFVLEHLEASAGSVFKHREKRVQTQREKKRLVWENTITSS